MRERLNRLKADLRWALEISWLKTSVKLASSKIGRQLPLILYLGGMGLITRGCWMAWHPLGWIFLGAVLVHWAWTSEKSEIARAEAEKLEKLYQGQPR
jgi:hypothetical protein